MHGQLESAKKVEIMWWEVSANTPNHATCKKQDKLFMVTLVLVQTNNTFPLLFSNKIDDISECFPCFSLSSQVYKGYHQTLMC